MARPSAKIGIAAAGCRQEPKRFHIITQMLSEPAPSPPPTQRGCPAQSKPQHQSKAWGSGLKIKGSISRMHHNTQGVNSFFFCNGAEHLRTDIRRMEIVAHRLFTNLSKAAAGIAHRLLSPEIRFLISTFRDPGRVATEGRGTQTPPPIFSVH